MRRKISIYLLWVATLSLFACNQAGVDNQDERMDQISLVTVAPGHFHAALVQKSMYNGVDSTVHVYAPEGPELEAHQALVTQYNTQEVDPTDWNQVVYTGDDFFEKMLEERRGNVAVLAGNNGDKTNYILKAVEAGFNVLADKPMAIDHQAFLALEQAFSLAEENGVLLYDIMTERYEINTILQREFSQVSPFFGELITGSVEEPAITKESVHHFFKEVSGKPLVRPGWFFDVQQQGEGIVDVTTHLVDLVQWECFPEQIIDYRKDIELISARRWPTKLTREQFERGTELSEVPEYLQKDLGQDGNLDIFSNGEIDYTIKGKHAKVSVIWDFEAPAGTGDTHYSIMRGDKAHLIIRQGAEENYKPVLYAVPADGQDDDAFQVALQEAIDQLASRYAGLAFSENANGEYQIHVDESLATTHEEHFAEVTRKYLGFLKAGEIPEWEAPNMIAKYYTTTQALEMARQ